MSYLPDQESREWAIKRATRPNGSVNVTELLSYAVLNVATEGQLIARALGRDRAADHPT